MTGLTLAYLNAISTAANIGAYAAWHNPWNVVGGVFCGFVALFIALEEAR